MPGAGMGVGVASSSLLLQPYMLFHQIKRNTFSIIPIGTHPTKPRLLFSRFVVIVSISLFCSPYKLLLINMLLTNYAKDIVFYNLPYVTFERSKHHSIVFCVLERNLLQIPYRPLGDELWLGKARPTPDTVNSKHTSIFPSPSCVSTFGRFFVQFNTLQSSCKMHPLCVTMSCVTVQPVLSN